MEERELRRVDPSLDIANFILPKSVHQWHSKASIGSRKLFFPHLSFLDALRTITLSGIFPKHFPSKTLPGDYLVAPVEHRLHDHPHAIENLLPVLLSNYKEKQAKISDDKYFHRHLSRDLLAPCFVLCEDPCFSRGEAAEHAPALLLPGHRAWVPSGHGVCPRREGSPWMP